MRKWTKGFIVGAAVGMICMLLTFPPVEMINIIMHGNPLPTLTSGKTYRIYGMQQAFDERTGKPIFWITAARTRPAYLSDIHLTVHIEQPGVKLYVMPQADVDMRMLPNLATLVSSRSESYMIAMGDNGHAWVFKDLN